MKELSKSITRRLGHSNFLRKYFVGNGIDIGGKPDPLNLYREFFPLVQNIRTWDIEDGDAQLLATVEDRQYDFVHSSHCLEHLVDPYEGIMNWFRAVKLGGHLIITVPDEDLYEQGTFPSSRNLDHKWTFTIYKQVSWSEKSINLFDLIQNLGAEARVEKVELLNSTYRYELPVYDQTQTPVGECAIEFIVKKVSEEEASSGGMMHASKQPIAEDRIHYNQYRDDYRSMKSQNSGHPPFTNDEEL